MPIQEKIEIKDGFICIWKIDESENELIKWIDECFLSNIKSIKSPKTRTGSLVSRAALTYLLRSQNINFKGIKKDAFGKPHLLDCDYHLSLSHSDGYAAVLLSKNNFSGIDIETKFEQCYRLRNKFCNDFELEFIGNSIEKSALIWSAKESIYKAYGRKKLIFKDDIVLKQFDSNTILFQFKKLDKVISIDFFDNQKYILSIVNLNISNLKL